MEIETLMVEFDIPIMDTSIVATNISTKETDIFIMNKSLVSENIHINK